VVEDKTERVRAGHRIYPVEQIGLAGTPK